MENFDNSEIVTKLDKSDMLSIIRQFPQQWKEAAALGQELHLPADYRKLNKIVVTGLGGSAMGGDILCSYLNEEAEIPIFVNRHYTLPRFVDENTLLLVVSYSGNTEETISAYRQGIDLSAQVVTVTSGGKLRELSDAKNIPLVIVPPGMPPRTALGYLFLPLLTILEKLELVKAKREDIKETALLLEELSRRWGPASPLDENLSKSLARKLLGKLPLIYGSELLKAVCLRWKTQINENSKSLAYPAVFPELNHNEIIGWEGMEELRQNLEIIILRDEGDQERIKKRIEITKSVLDERPGGLEEVWSEGKSLLARLFSLIYLGDWISFYLAILYSVDPTPVESIELLKKRLAEQ
ncbi:bifunctional phosphoglucose/phosphomannose isomerase [candidate division NPL-UPA2 bacterium]|nr:bifunctional phosphoglucose/phosphomannose isomerase [candidate division NPL-UPA2 bacterium]